MTIADRLAEALRDSLRYVDRLADDHKGSMFGGFVSQTAMAGRTILAEYDRTKSGPPEITNEMVHRAEAAWLDRDEWLRTKANEDNRAWYRVNIRAALTAALNPGVTAMTSYDDGQRGTGRTTKQMQDAPQGAIFVWCNEHTDYPRRLAKHLGRADLRIAPKSSMERDLLSGFNKPIIQDHAYYWASR
jgi:hypothetical protein